MIADIEVLMATAAPARILLIGDGGTASAAEYQAQQAVLGVDILVERITAADWLQYLDNSTEYDFVLVTNVLEEIPKSQGMQLLAGIRDKLGTQFCVYYNPNTDSAENTWQLHDFLSLGLVRVNHYKWDSHNSALFRYSLSSYKRTPDWLNADNWANPELWGKYWW